MAGKIPPQFLKNVKGKKASAHAGATSKFGANSKGNDPLPDFLKKGSKDQGTDASDSKNPFANLTKGKAKKKPLTAAEKKALAAKARKKAASSFGKADDAYDPSDERVKANLSKKK
jgi:hypothetical protein